MIHTPVTTDSFTSLYPQAIRLLRRGWLPIVLFSCLSIPGWMLMGKLHTPEFSLLATSPKLFFWNCFVYAGELGLMGVIIAIFTLGPATFWLLRIQREIRQPLPIHDAILGVLIPAVLDLMLGMSITLSVFGFGLVTVAGFAEYAGMMPQAVRVIMLFLLLIMFGMIFIMIVGIIYPRLRWIAVASLSGDCAITERLRFTRHFPHASSQILWRVTALEQMTAFALTIIGGVIAAHFITMPSLTMDPFSDPVAQLDNITKLISAESGPAIALLNGLGWIAIWLFLPLWVVAYEWLPKPVSAARTNDGKINSTT